MGIWRLTPSILITFFFLGLSSMVVQALMIREFLVIYYGNELCVGVIFFFWLLSIALGTALYALLSRKTAFSISIFASLLLFCAAVPFLQVYLVRCGREIIGVAPGAMIPFLPMAGWTLAAIFPYGLAVGALFPMGCSLLGSHRQDAVSPVYSAESAGALAGGALFSCFLVGRVFPLLILWATGMCLALCSLTLSLKEGKGRFTALAPAAFITAALMCLSCLGAMDSRLTMMRWNSLTGRGLPLLASCDSPYQNLALTGQGGLCSLYGNGEYTLSFPDPWQQRIDAGLIMSGHPAPHRMAVIGVVAGGFLRECLKHDVQSIHYIVLDNLIFSFISPWLTDYDRGGYCDGRVISVSDDGRHWANSTNERFDIVAVALPDPSSALINRFYTREFFASLARILEDDGVVVLSLASSANYMGSEVGDYNASVFQTLRSVFPYTAISPGDRCFFFASRHRGVVTEDPGELSRRIEARSTAGKEFPSPLFAEFFDRERVALARKALERGGVPVNSDMQPLAYYYSLILWDRISGSCLTPFLKFFKSFKIHHGILILLTLLMARILMVLKMKISEPSQVRTNLVIAVALLGFAAMGLEIVIVFSFQNLYGSLYRMIGILIASYMAGLTAGALASTVMKRPCTARDFMVLQAVLAFFSFLLPFFITLFSHTLYLSLPPALGQVLFAAVIFVMGSFNGFGFPCACMLFPGEEKNRGMVTGSLNFFDHAGAALGGLLCGTILVPVLGISSCCHMIGALAFCSAALWLPAARYENDSL